MNTSDGQLHMRWRTVALVAVVLALAASVLAAIVSSIRNVDVLSVIALALAVIAFVVQIIVYIAQADAAAKQQVQASEVYGKTISALAAIEAKAEGTRTTVNTLSDRLLDAAIGKAIPEAESEGSPVASDAFAETVSRIVKDIVNAPNGQAVQADRPRAEIRVEDDTMRILPSPERVSKALDALAPLGTSAVANLERLASDQARSGGTNGPRIGPGLRTINPYSAKDLIDGDLAVRRRVPWSSTPVFQLTDLGKDAGRLLLAEDSANVSDPRFRALKGLMVEHHRKMTRQSDPEEMYKDIPIAP